MPELPEIETIVQDLRVGVSGRTLVGSLIEWAGSIADLPPEEFARRIAGKRIEGVSRRGKNIVVQLSGDELLLIHLRMTGRLMLARHGQPSPRFLRVSLLLDNGDELHFADQRKFGRLRLWSALDLARLEARLGPEPLADLFTPQALEGLLRRRRTRLKALLLDQSFLAGIGNIYADEALFTAGLHPHREASSLTQQESLRLYEALRQVLRQGISDRGTSFSDYLDARGKPGSHQEQLLVYRRTGQPCARCGTTIERLRFGGRGTHYCPRCQRLDSAAS